MNLQFYNKKAQFSQKQAKFLLNCSVLITVLLFSGGFVALHPQEGNDLSYFGQEEMDFVLGEQNLPWNYPRLIMIPMYNMTSGDLSTHIPYEFGYIIAMDHGIHHLLKPVYRRKSPLLPGFRVEYGYFQLGPDDIRGMSVTGGLIWLVPIDKKQKFKVFTGVLGGMSFMRGQLSEYVFSNDAGYICVTGGVDIQLSSIFLSVSGRYNKILDSKVAYSSFGGGLGIGYQFSTKSSEVTDVGN